MRKRIFSSSQLPNRVLLSQWKMLKIFEINDWMSLQWKQYEFQMFFFDYYVHKIISYSIIYISL